MKHNDQESTGERLLESRSNVISQTAAALLALGAIAISVFGFGAAWFWVMLGALVWFAALLVKLCLAGIIYLYVPGNSPKINAILSGTQSSISELGIAALLFHLYQPKTSLVENVLAFGTGAGATEILFLLGMMYFEKTPPETVGRWLKAAKTSFCVRYGFFLERAITLLGHIGSRGLIGLSILGQSYELAAIAFLSFAITDGLAQYGNTKEWNWFDPFTCRAFYGFCAVISAIEVGLFAVFARRLF